MPVTRPNLWLGTSADVTSRLKSRDERASGGLASALDRMPLRRAHIFLLGLVAFGTLINAIEEYNVGLAAPLIRREWSLSNTGVGLLTTLTFVGMAVGAVLAGVAGDRYGRRVVFIYNLALYTVGALLGAFSPGFGWLLAARLVVGIGLGGELNTGLTMVAELMPTRYRGAGIATVNVAGGGLGIFASSALAAVMLGPLENVLGGPTVAWRWLLGILALPALLLSMYRRWLPESPRFLMLCDRVDETNQVLTRLARNRLRPLPPTSTVPAASGSERPRPVAQQVRFSDVLRRPMRRNTLVTWVVCAMTFGAQVTITVFMPTILVSRGLNLGSSLTFAMLINAGGLAGALLASACGYWFKRRVVLGCGAAAAAGLAVAAGTASTVTAVLVWGGLLQLVVLLLNTTTFVWVTELYPTRLRAFGTGASVAVLLFSASVVPLLAGVVDDAAGTTAIFLLVSVMYAIMAIAVRFGAETHGRSLEQIDVARPRAVRVSGAVVVGR